MVFTFTASVDPKALAKAQKLTNWQPILQKHLGEAVTQSLQEMGSSAIGYCFSMFKSPSGALEGRFSVQGPLVSGNAVMGYLVNDSPYAYRREYGFSGMTDSRGRTYRYDPG